MCLAVVGLAKDNTTQSFQHWSWDLDMAGLAQNHFTPKVVKVLSSALEMHEFSRQFARVV